MSIDAYEPGAHMRSFIATETGATPPRQPKNPTTGVQQ